jgi:hypothetical protein
MNNVAFIDVYNESSQYYFTSIVVASIVCFTIILCLLLAIGLFMCYKTKQHEKKVIDEVTNLLENEITRIKYNRSIKSNSYAIINSSKKGSKFKNEIIETKNNYKPITEINVQIGRKKFVNGKITFKEGLQIGDELSSQLQSDIIGIEILISHKNKL